MSGCKTRTDEGISVEAGSAKGCTFCTPHTVECAVNTVSIHDNFYGAHSAPYGPPDWNSENYLCRLVRNVQIHGMRTHEERSVLFRTLQ